MESEIKTQEEISQASSATQKEFIIDIKGLDIKTEIKNAVQSFVKEQSLNGLEKQLDKLVNEAVKRLTPNFVEIPGRKKIKLEGRTHKAFKECLFLAEHERQIFISGPAGSGKTTLGEQIAKAFGLKFGHISCSAGISEAHLLGRMLFDGTYVSSDFIELYENGGVFLADEIDAADANTLLTLNSALANGIVSVPNRRGATHASRHKDFILIASGNTWGSGSFEYHGRNHLDAAFLDRFTLSKVNIDYDLTLEKEIISEYQDELSILWKIREACDKYKIRRIVSTRAFISGVRQLKAGRSMKDILDSFLLGWSDEEKRKIKEHTKEAVAA